MKVFFNNDYTASHYAFDTTRKSAEVAKNVPSIYGAEIADPTPFYTQTEKMLRDTHDPAYIQAVKTGTPEWVAESQGFTWDEFTYPMVLAHNAGCVAATHAVLKDGESVSGTLSSGLHHARYSNGSGFCTFNGIAVASNTATRIGTERILVLDFDAHCGGGTYSLIGDNVTQVDVSTSAFDGYKIRDNDKSRLVIVDDDDDYLPSIEGALKYANGLGSWDFVIYNAGMDPINDGITSAILSHREAMVTDFIRSTGTPAIFTLAGGYTWGGITMNDLVDLHSLTIEAFADITENVLS